MTGILNGVDYEEWNTLHNGFLAHPYSIDDLEGKVANKLALQKELGLPADAATPLFASVGRLVEQKGVDIMLAALDEMLAADIQLVLLGTGPPVFERAYEDLAGSFPKKAAVRIGYEEGLSHRIEAGGDFFLMPSRFEPCGLNQMYSLHYGTNPIVRQTGDIREDPEKANGIKFVEYSASALGKGIRKAMVLYKQPDLLLHFRKNAMSTDFSWERTAEQYLKVYDRILGSAA